MKIIWKTLELADWKVASFDPSIVFSCIFLVVAACVLFSFVFLFPNMPLTYWGSLGDTLRGARPGHNPFGSASIVWWERCFKWVLSAFRLICVSLYIYNLYISLFMSLLCFLHFIVFYYYIISIYRFHINTTWHLMQASTSPQQKWLRIKCHEMRSPLRHHAKATKCTEAQCCVQWGSGDVWRFVLLMTAAWKWSHKLLNEYTCSASPLDWMASSFSRFFLTSWKLKLDWSLKA